MNESKLKITEKDDEVCFTNPDNFMVISDFTESDVINTIENVIVTTKAENNNAKSCIVQLTDSISYFKNSYGDVEIFTFISNDVMLQDFAENLKVLNSEKGFVDARINISHVICINRRLSQNNLMKIYRDVTKAKAKYFASLNLPLHIENILNTDDFLAVLANSDGEYSDINDIEISIEEAVEISLEDAFERLNLTFGILDYLVAEGILIGDLVGAGMELLNGVEITEELEEKMEAQILNALTDINVIALIMAAIRTEDDLNRIREIDDSSHIYSDEVLGMAVANQIAGTKAVLNFRHYIDVKPGIIYGLPPIMEDVFAGLIAGCVSKIFEEK